MGVIARAKREPRVPEVIRYLVWKAEEERVSSLAVFYSYNNSYKCTLVINYIQYHLNGPIGWSISVLP